MSKTIGILREWKTDSERRAPLTPRDVKSLIESTDLKFAVESSPNRIFSDTSYTEAGAHVASTLEECDFYIGIKEVPLENLRPGKPHLFFSHTIKGQEYNMPLLRKILDLKCTLLDFELVRNDAGQRLIFFGRQAGQAGMLNTLWAFGKRLVAQGIDTPFNQLKQACELDDLADGLAQLKTVSGAIRDNGLPSELKPIVLGVTGTGNVSRGAQEVLAALDPIYLSPADLRECRGMEDTDAIYAVIFDEQDMVRRKDGAEFSGANYRQEPEAYESALADFLPSLSVLVTGHFWDVQYPKFVSKKHIADLFEQDEMPKLKVIGDVSCDPEGGIEVTLKGTYPDNPCYIYQPRDEKSVDGLIGDGLCIMAVEILPTELALDSSQVFSTALREFLPEVLAADFSSEFEDLKLPPPFKRAVIAHGGRLTSEWAHLLS